MLQRRQVWRHRRAGVIDVDEKELIRRASLLAGAEHAADCPGTRSLSAACHSFCSKPRFAPVAAEYRTDRARAAMGHPRRLSGP